MGSIINDIQEDFDYLNKRAVKYNLALKTITSEDKPPCFKPMVSDSQLQMIVWNMQELVKSMQSALTEEG